MLVNRRRIHRRDQRLLEQRRGIIQIVVLAAANQAAQWVDRHHAAIFQRFDARRESRRAFALSCHQPQPLWGRSRQCTAAQQARHA
jgi:hypothetical protein